MTLTESFEHLHEMNKKHTKEHMDQVCVGNDITVMQNVLSYELHKRRLDVIQSTWKRLKENEYLFGEIKKRDDLSELKERLARFLETKERWGKAQTNFSKLCQK